MALQTERSTPGTTATSATIASNSSRFSVTLVNDGIVDLFISERATNAGTPATSTAHSVKLIVGSAITLFTTAALYVFTAAGTGSLQWVEDQ